LDSRLGVTVLSDTKIRNAKPTEKPYKLSDSGGLFLLVQPTGSRWWRLKYRYAGKERGISLGVYPAVSLKDARERRDEAKKLLARGVDPSAKRQTAKVAQADTFKVIADEWIELQAKKQAPSTSTKTRWMFEQFLFPEIGSRQSRTLPLPSCWPPFARSRRAGRTRQRTALSSSLAE
jgi:Arm DNA-binding domain/Phage integrase central domain